MAGTPGKYGRCRSLCRDSVGKLPAKVPGPTLRKAGTTPAAAAVRSVSLKYW